MLAVLIQNAFNFISTGPFYQAKRRVKMIFCKSGAQQSQVDGRVCYNH